MQHKSYKIKKNLHNIIDFTKKLGIITLNLHDMQEEGERMNHNKLKGKLKEMGLTYEDCAKELGMSIAAFNNKMNGTSKFTIPEAQQLSQVAKMTDEEKVLIFLG